MGTTKKPTGRKKVACIHCGQVKTIAGRGVCNKCYYHHVTVPMSNGLEPLYLTEDEIKAKENVENAGGETPIETAKPTKSTRRREWMDKLPGDVTTTHTEEMVEHTPTEETSNELILIDESEELTEPEPEKKPIGDGNTTCLACGKKLGKFKARGLCNSCWVIHVKEPQQRGESPHYPMKAASYDAEEASRKRKTTIAAHRRTLAPIISKRKVVNALSGVSVETNFWAHAIWLTEELRLDIHETFAFGDLPYRLVDQFPGYRLPLREDQSITIDALEAYSQNAFGETHPLVEYLGAIITERQIKTKIDTLETEILQLCYDRESAISKVNQMIHDYKKKFE